MSVIEHLEALRRVLIVSAVAVAAASIVAWFLHATVLDYLIHQAHLPQGQAYYNSLTTPFLIGLKLSLYLGLVLASPVVFQQIWWFVSPGLHLHERRLVLPLVISSSIFFLIGISFAIYALPLFTRVLLSFATPDLKPLIQIDSLLGFVIGIILAFGIVFELPVVLFMLGQLGIVSSRWLYHTRIYWIIGMAVVANVLTPGADPLTPMLLFVPLMIFWEGTVLVLRLMGR
ncbi:MAG TPA: twin-arginine translocase subunit TatC [Candidatus Nitrosotalea sp.]|nr:twin-arginine translocase subunit TatC [Candidatus Nitrosotalea sp.]